MGVGADLAPSTLVRAYRRGIFPWPHPRMPLPWFSPDPRGILTSDSLHVSRSLRQRLRRCGWTATVDNAFAAVVAGCAEPRGDNGTWITRSMARAYLRLHDLGWAHSVEIWDGHALVGGLYGVQIGGCFTGESMFRRVSDASKVALVELVQRFSEAGGSFVDVQLVTPHLCQQGARGVSRSVFLRMLAEVEDQDVRFALDLRPVARLATQPVRREQ
ncbi:MAG: leucyl/phenylalanyl-tRNA--protein transferase [Actinomycetota bacterium]|nr:leucyl/phenylalanyl-tRNA--protein transferase [Actinomycetota bacterium]